VVVTHHPDEGVIELLQSVAPQVDQVIVVDNGSTAFEAGPIRAWAERAGATWIGNPANVGSATALNHAAEAALSAGHSWLLTLDQDTAISVDLVMHLRTAISADAEPKQVAIAAPQTDHQRDRRCRDRAVVRRRMAITSGSLMSLAAWQEVGGFRDEFFIDMVEADFALRLAQRGYRVILACRASIGHHIGRPRTHRILGRAVETSNHPPWRRYYISRNRVIVWREHWRTAPVWVLFDGYGEVRDTVVIALTEDDRRRKLRAKARGLRDGLRGRMDLWVRPVDPT
jgi:rhamnosyltransferase